LQITPPLLDSQSNPRWDAIDGDETRANQANNADNATVADVNIMKNAA
jgi:hypothetical protein